MNISKHHHAFKKLKAVSSISAILLSVTVPAVQAAPTWSTPIQLGQPIALINLEFNGSIALDPLQNSVAVWNANGIIQSSSQVTGGVYTPAADISQNADYEEAIEPGVAMNPLGTGAAMAIWTSHTAVPDQSHVYKIKVSTKIRNGAWTMPVIITPSTTGSSNPRISIDIFNNAVAVWQNCGPSACVIQAASKPNGRAWSAPVTISPANTTGASNPQLALNPLGQAVAVWESSAQSGKIQAASKGLLGGWSSAVDISTPSTPSYSPKIAIDALGRAVVVWNENAAIAATYRAINGTWSVPKEIVMDIDPSLGFFGPNVAMDLAGNAMVVWSGIDVNGNNLVQVSNGRPGSPWGAPNNVLSSFNETPGEPRVAMAPGGKMKVVTWVDNSQNVARAVTKLGTSAWGVPVTLSNAIALNGTAIEVAANVGSKARALWGQGIFSPSGGQAFVPLVSSFSP